MNAVPPNIQKLADYINRQGDPLQILRVMNWILKSRQ